MNRHDALLGRYLPGHSFLHRMPTGPKWLMLFVLTLVSLLSNSVSGSAWWITGILALLAAGMLLAARIPLRMALWPGWAFIILLVVVCGYQLVGRHAWRVALVVGFNLLACLWLGRALTLTTPINDLVDAIARALDPLARIGVPAERIGLAVGLMLRSIPYLIGSYGDVRDAASARGLERNWFARLTPVIIGAVAYAHRTGDALIARGLGDD